MVIIKIESIKNLFLTLITIAILSTLGCSSCKKEIVIDNSLPPTTQTGSNTLGFTLNGQPWKPQGQVGVSANLTVNVDFGYDKGIFSINAYRVVPNSITEYFGFGLKDSLNYLNLPASIPLSNSSLYGIRFANRSCQYYSNETGTYVSGILTIIKLDKTNKILAGTFTATLSKQGCDTIKITDGRFDMKY